LAHRAQFEEMLDEHLQLGDSRAACVISIEPLVVAAYTDELDCVAMLGFPDWLAEEHRLNVGDRLLTVNTYRAGEGSGLVLAGGRPDGIALDLEAGPGHTGRWINFYPVIAEFVSDDVERIAQRKAAISEKEWARCDRLGFASWRDHPKRRRNGSPFWSLQPVTIADLRDQIEKQRHRQRVSRPGFLERIRMSLNSLFR
jgi:hypothetical protein